MIRLAAYAEEQERDTTYIAPFVPTPQEVVDRMPSWLKSARRISSMILDRETEES
jgi:hypothetical protein